MHTLRHAARLPLAGTCVCRVCDAIVHLRHERGRDFFGKELVPVDAGKERMLFDLLRIASAC